MMDGTAETSARFVGCHIALARNSVYPGHHQKLFVQEDNSIFLLLRSFFRDKIQEWYQGIPTIRQQLPNTVYMIAKDKYQLDFYPISAA